MFSSGASTMKRLTWGGTASRSGLGKAVLASLALAASLTPWVAAAAPLTPYFVQHTFTLRPGGSVLPQVTEFDFQHAWIQSDALPGVFQFNPGGQPAAANPFGMEFQMATGQV